MQWLKKNLAVLGEAYPDLGFLTMDAGLAAQLATIIQNQRANALFQPMPIYDGVSSQPYSQPVSKVPQASYIRPPPGLKHIMPIHGGPKTRQISKSSMSTAESEVEQMEDHEELESNASAEASGDMIARSWDSALRELLHSVPRLARDMKGAPLLTQHINAMDAQGLTLLVAALRPQLADLACDAAGTGVVQQAFRSCSDMAALRLQLVQGLQGNVQRLTKDKHGCLVIQEALESATREMQIPIMSELKGKVFYCSRHMHGNFVMQKVIQTLPPNALGFMIYELKENAVAAALHIYACRVLQRLIECCGMATTDLVDILLQPGEQLQRLVKDPYSSNVVRSMVVCGNVSHVQTVMQLFSTDVMKYSRNRHASLVLEKCLEVSAFGVKAAALTQERRELMSAFFSTARSASPPLLQIMLDRFGNYIVQRVIDTCSGTEKEEVKRLLGLALPKLQSSAAGKHILSAAAKKFGMKVHSLTAGQ